MIPRDRKILSLLNQRLFKLLVHTKQCARGHSVFGEGYGTVEALRESHSDILEEKALRAMLNLWFGEERCHI